MSSDYEYIIVGGGTVGCVLALSYLSCRLSGGSLRGWSPKLFCRDHEPNRGSHLRGTEAEYNWKTVPQPGHGNREIDTQNGKILSGSSGVNCGLWMRGHSANYDAWASHVDRKHRDLHASREVHGFDRPISTFAGLRNYPLKTNVFNALRQSGLKFNPDGNSGTPFGISLFTDNWKNNLRQSAGLAYGLSQTDVFTSTMVAREVIVCSGAIKSPQILTLSGRGPKEHLESFGIPTLSDLPFGQNLHDHISGSLFWKLRDPENGLAIGSPNFNHPKYFTGMPFDWIATITVPDETLAPAAAADGHSIDTLFGTGPRAHVEMLTAYAPIASAGTLYRLPFDGTHIATPVILLLPPGRGQITLASTDAADDPIIDPQYLSSEVDRAITRKEVRAAVCVMETSEASTFVEHETPPAGFPRLTSASTDAEIDARLAYIGASFFQNAGTMAMGSVLETDCKIKGIAALRVCDASILPFPIASHYQTGIYGIAEATADIILGNTS
ncbi:GMC oxidoreductase [Lentithecium fluviatile CBS 122367]|uniref:GMC oxidoreductase n=1 Tax=Lentithecium fluviatile CBS 122367 TaxID=1168545 RepID=A0A6G1IV42_9PLEO|nr:GMC oxidoreductase [Lentithecium fluviatile CBS 122367]